MKEKPRVITLKEDTELRYTDHLGDVRALKKKKGETVYYTREIWPGWTVHTCWAVVQGYAGERYPRRFEAVRIEYHHPLLTIGVDPCPPPGSLVMVQGKYEGELIGETDVGGLFPGRFYHVEYAEGPLCGTYIYTRQIQLIKAAEVKPEKKPAKRKDRK
jgi:hypothetical protein